VTFPPEERESFISDAVAEIAANRAVIEQVKGILMIVYRIDADAAFDLPCRRRTSVTDSPPG
jgi:AmiR/NasT family two-component response regulator